MKIKSLSKIQICLLALLGFIVVRFVFFRAPSEAEMISKFHRHRAEFEEIRLMLQQDRNVVTIGPDWVTGKWVNGKGELPVNISVSRLALYRSRLKKLGFFRVDSYDGGVQLEEFGGGFTDTSWGIGYIWSSTTPTPLVRSAYNQMPRRDDRHFSRLDGDWYIYQRR